MASCLLVRSRAVFRVLTCGCVPVLCHQPLMAWKLQVAGWFWTLLTVLSCTGAFVYNMLQHPDPTVLTVTTASHGITLAVNILVTLVISLCMYDTDRATAQLYDVFSSARGESTRASPCSCTILRRHG